MVRFFASAVIAFSYVAQGSQATWAQDSSLKLGLVAYQQILVATNEGKEAVHDTQAQFATKKAEMDALSKRVDLLKVQASTKETISASELQARQSTYSQTAKKLEADAKSAGDAYNAVLEQRLKTISQKLVPFMQTFALKNGYTMIIDVSDEKSNILWAQNGLDISQDLVKALLQTCGGRGKMC